MTRLILPVATFIGTASEPEWSAWECISEIEGMPTILWRIDCGDAHSEFVLFAQDHAATDMIGDWGEHKTVVLTPLVSIDKLDPAYRLGQFGFKRIELDLQARWEIR